MKYINPVIILSYLLALSAIFFSEYEQAKAVKQCTCGVCGVCKQSANMGAIPLAIPLGLVGFFLLAVIVAVMNALREM